MAKGETKTKKADILNMYKEGADIDFISRVVKLPKEEIKKIIKDNQKT